MQSSNDEMPNSEEQLSGGQISQQTILRYVVKDAVDREVGLQVAPVLNRQQVFDGQLRVFNQELGALSQSVSELRNVVLGNEQLGIIGVQRQITKMDDKLNTLIDQKEALENQLKGVKQTVWAASGLVGTVIAIVGWPNIRALFNLIGGP